MRAKTDVLIVGGGEDAQRVCRDTVAGTRGPARGGVEHWCGLRPASASDVPYIGELRPFQGLYLASGHYRLGIHPGDRYGTVVGGIDVRQRAEFASG